MGRAPKKIDKVKLFSGIILSPGLDLATVVSALEAEFGPHDYLSPEIDFNRFTAYYNREMGEGLKRYFIAFRNLEDRTILPDVKLKTIALEKRFAGPSGRRVNLDPGYMTLGQIFLASTKDNFFRIYLRDTIYAEVTLYYEAGKYVSFPYTYRDYDSKDYKDIFLDIRALYRGQL